MPNRHQNSIFVRMTVKKLDLVRTLSPLERSFNVFTATLFCIGSTFGSYFYLGGLLLGRTLWFYASVAWVLGGLVTMGVGSFYAELSSEWPCSGGVYSWCYNTMGELYAFLVGWLLVLLRSCRVMYVGRLIANYGDAFDGTFTIFTTNIFEPSFRWGGFYAILLTCGFVTTNMRESIISVAVAVLFNIGTVFAVVLTMLYYVKPTVSPPAWKTENTVWDVFRITVDSLHEAFLGFSAVVHLGEETKKPEMNIPKSIMFTIPFVAVCLSLLQTLRFFLPVADNDSNPGDLMLLIGALVPNYLYSHVIGIGGMCSAIAAVYTSMLSLTRLLYAMSSDGLIFHKFSKVHHRTNNIIHLTSFLLSCVLGIVQIFIDLKIIKNCVSYLTYFEYLHATICLILKRYRCDEVPPSEDTGDRWVLFNYPNALNKPTGTTYHITKLLLCLFLLTTYIQGVSYYGLTLTGHSVCKYVFYFSPIFALYFGICLGRQPQNLREDLYFSTVGVPLMPLCFLGFIVIRMTSFRILIFGIAFAWLLIGTLFYFVYSQHYSVESGKVYPCNPGERWNILLKPQMIDPKR